MKKFFAVIIAGLWLFSLQAQAQQPAELALSAGAFEVFESDNSAELGAEYRFRSMDNLWGIVPAVGLSVNADGAYWAHAGLRYDLSLGERFLLTPQLAVVGYEDGGSMDLGSGFLFRSGLELGYRLSAHSKLSLTLYHMSNANLADDNPGSESVIVSYSFSPESWR